MPRMAAGGPLTNDVFKCALKSIDARDYAVALSGEEQARLKKIFPQGVCDWSAPGLERRPFLDLMGHRMVVANGRRGQRPCGSRAERVHAPRSQSGFAGPTGSDRAVMRKTDACRESGFQDIDHEFLFEPQMDGIDKSGAGAQMGMQSLSRRDAVKRFTNR